MTRLIILVMFLVIFFGCETIPLSSITIGGGYGDYAGEITIALDEEKTLAEGALVVEEKRGGDAKTLYTFDEQELQGLQGLLDKIKDEKGASAKIRVDKTIYQQLKQAIGGHNARQY